MRDNKKVANFIDRTLPDYSRLGLRALRDFEELTDHILLPANKGIFPRHGWGRWLINNPKREFTGQPQNLNAVLMADETKFADAIDDEILELEQQADKLKGSYTLSSDISEGMTASSYIFSGYISDGFVIGTARPRDRNSIYHTTFCLKIVEELDALCLKGILSGLTLKTNEVHSWEVTFQRKST